MIVVTRLNGPRFAVNPDLLQRVESTPDTILTLIDGTKYIVEESLELSSQATAHGIAGSAIVQGTVIDVVDLERQRAGGDRSAFFGLRQEQGEAAVVLQRNGVALGDLELDL